MIALTDSGLAVVVEAASRLASGANRADLLRKFAAAAERGSENRPRAAARSPDAERMRKYRSRLRREIAIVPVPVTGAIVGYLARAGLLRRDREAHGRDEIGRAIAAVLERAAQADR